MLDTETDAVVARAAHQLSLDAASNSLINASFDTRALHDALLHSPEPTWILERGGRISAHLYGALLGSREERAAWSGPDGYSYDDLDDLVTLLEYASDRWREHDVRQHFVWCLDRPEHLNDWLGMGFVKFSTRAALDLARTYPRARRDAFTVRRGTREDLAAAYDLDEQLDRAQGDRPELRTTSERDAVRQQVRETVEDPENNHFVVEYEGRVVAQCVTFAAPQRRGSFPRTIFLSEVAVDRAFRRRGIARLLVDHALAHARDARFEYCETQWRASNEQGARFWTDYGFRATYSRLRRAL